MWKRGETIVHHEVWAGRVWAARPLVVVEDGDDRLVLWLPHGTRRKVPAPPADVTTEVERGVLTLATEASHRGVVENLERGDWDYVDHEWDVSSLWILRPHDWHAVWCSWLPGGEHVGWYVNLQRPYRRTGKGIEAMDLMLDVVVEPDLTWRLKDEAEFEIIATRGIFDVETVRRVRAEAAAVVGRIESRGAPFGEPWPSWSPDPSWTLPVLPDDWQDLPDAEEDQTAGR